MTRLAGKVVMITGASSGIGKQTARAVVREGGKVVIGARRADRLQRLQEELGHANAVWRATDVAVRTDLQALAQEGLDRFGRIDALVANAGIMPLSRLADRRVEDWDRMIDVNIKGVLYAIDSVLPHMLERGSGDVVDISSVAGHTVSAVSGVYSATKFAVRAISEGLRKEAVGKIRVTTICPGAVATELGGSITDERLRERMAQFMSMAMDASVIADAVVYALSQPPGVAVNEIIIRPLAQEM